MNLVWRRHGKELSDEATGAIMRVQDALLRMEELLDGISSLTTVEAESQIYNLVNTREIVEQAVGNLNKVIESRGAEVTIDSLPQEMYANHAQLVLVFQNLLSNALKFCRETPKINIGGSRDDDTWTFYVSDNGIGIEAEYKDKLFKLFTRLQGRRQFPGTGLGLALCKTIVERHGGKIWFESKDVGTTFFFSLPVREGADQMNTTPIKILLAEDNPDDVELVRAALIDTGISHSLKVAEDGVEALEYLRQSDKSTHPDLLLLDLNMPRMTGLEVLEQIKDEKELADIPIVLLTVSDSEEEIVKAFQLRMHYYIRKPIEPLKLWKLLSVINDTWRSPTGETFHKANEISYVLAGNPNTPADVLGRLSHCKEEAIRVHLAENPALGEDLLTALAQDDSAEVRMTVAGHPKLPLPILERLSEDPSVDVRLEIAANPKIPDTVRQRLIHDENPFVSNKAVSSTATLK